jgi:hypothetical protein
MEKLALIKQKMKALRPMSAWYKIPNPDPGSREIYFPFFYYKKV